jgi:hypothetical protein
MMSKLPKRTNTIKVPIKFDDDDKNVRISEHTKFPGTPLGGALKHTIPSLTPEAQPATPGLSRYYKVPNTVKKKSWDF